MNRRRMAGVAGTVLVCLLIAGVGHILGEEKKCVVLDAEGSMIAEVAYQDGAIHYECEEGYEAYVDLAYREAAAIVKEQENVEEAEAFRWLIKDEMHIRTACRQDIEEGILKTCAGENTRKFASLAAERVAAVGDTAGHILACYSGSEAEPARNYMTYPAYAGSTIKPISVYGPAVEEGTICWSSEYLDSAYCQIAGENGEKRDWPANTYPYSNRMQPVQEALQKSNNAIAVKVLKDYGVKKACIFLSEQLGIGTAEEQDALRKKGEDSVLSNIALGYLEEGVTIREMLGAYQTFANGGMHTAMHTVTGMEQKAGGSYYRESQSSRRVFTEDAAYIMNRMLKTVVEEGGTGEAAKMEGLDICGKTGTSNDFKDNWFIGMTPQYVCAVWYECQDGVEAANESAGIFREIMENLDHNKSIEYPAPEGVSEELYCYKTGFLANEYCEDKRTGYYSQGNLPKKCDCHCETQENIDK